MKAKLKVNLFKAHFNVLIFLVWVKLLFSYLGVKLSYFQRHLSSNIEKYNFLGLPENFSNKVEFILLPLLLIFVFRYRRYSKTIKTLVLMSFFMYSLNIITSFITGISILESVTYSLKIFTPIYLFCALIIYNLKTGQSIKPILIRTIYFCLFLTVVALLFFNPSFNRLRNYLPIYFEGLHTHSYIYFCILWNFSARPWRPF